MEDLRAALERFPESADWRVGVATYTEGPGSDIAVMYVGSYLVEPVDEVVLVPEGLGPSFKLAEGPITASQLLLSLQSKPEIASYRVFAKSDAVELPDGSIVSTNDPLWGTGVQDEGRLVYFYYGRGAESQ